MSTPFNRLRICIIGPVPPPAGGMANQTAELCRLLADEGAQVTLVETNAPYRPAIVGRIRGLRALFRLLPYLLRLRNTLKHAEVAHLMANSGWSWYLFATPAIWIAHWLGTPLVVNYRGGHAERFFAQSWSRVWPSLKRTRACIVPSAFLAEVFARRQVATVIIPNTLNSTLFFPRDDQCADSAMTDQDRVSSGPVIVITRNLESIYGIDLALQAMPRILDQYPKARLLVAGSGPERAALERLAEQLLVSTQVDFLGRLNRDQIAELYRRADLLLNPSRVDNSPNSIIEALGCGLPVVSTRAGGIPKLVSHGDTALLVEPESPDELANAVLALLENPLLRQTLRDRGLEYSRRFHWNRVKTDLLRVYQQALESTP